MTHAEVVEIMNRPIVRIPMSLGVFALLMWGIIWLSSGVLE